MNDRRSLRVLVKVRLVIGLGEGEQEGSGMIEEIRHALETGHQSSLRCLGAGCIYSILSLG